MFKNIIKPVYAHCDVPCGVYETDTMRNAAFTCKIMVEKYLALGEVDDENPNSMNQAIRIIMNKEKHAQLCKEQMYLLWSDYFKNEHLESNKNLHDIFWLASKQCSKVKQTIDINECEKLIEMVHDIEHIFKSTQK